MDKNYLGNAHPPVKGYFRQHWPLKRRALPLNFSSQKDSVSLKSDITIAHELLSFKINT